MDEERIRAEFYTWLKQGNSGCLFAKILAQLQDSCGWETAIVSGTGTAEGTPDRLHQIASALLNSRNALTVIFPEVKGPDQIATLIRSLCTHSNWKATHLPDAGANNNLLVGLRWLSPNPEHVNWIIGFADIPTMPPTRRAPYTSIVIRLGGPGTAAGIRKADPDEPSKRKREYGRVPVHVADIPVMPPVKSDEQLLELWKKTELEKQKRLGGDQFESAARARVTFTLPITCKSYIPNETPPA